MARKRGNGEGAIYKRTIKGNDYYIVEVTLGFDEQGKRIKRTTSAKSHTEAVNRLQQMQTDLRGGTLVKSEKISLYTWLVDYLNNFKLGKIEQSTFDSYKGLADYYFKDSLLGKKQLQKIVTTDIQNFMLSLEQKKVYETIRKMKVLLNMAFRKAVQLSLLSKNVVEYVELAKAKKTNIVSTLTIDEVQKLLEAAYGHRIYPAIKLALDTGLRRGELLALRWDDIDIDQGLLRVRQNVVETSVGKLIKSPKTEDSLRTVALLPESILMLNELRSQSTQRYVFSQVNTDAPMSPRYFTKMYMQICYKAGLANTKFHTLRHTHATELLEADVNTKVVSERLGHTDIRTTFNIYVHPSEEFHKNELQKLQLKRASPANY